MPVYSVSGGRTLLAEGCHSDCYGYRDEVASSGVGRVRRRTARLRCLALYNPAIKVGCC